MSIHIRDAVKADRDEIVFMMNRFQDHMESCNPNIWHITVHGRDAIPDRVDDMLSGIRKTFIAEMSKYIIGFAHCHVERRLNYYPGTVGYLDMLYVKKNNRREGGASRLIRRVCNYFTNEHVLEVNLRYVVDNVEAETLWSSLGFKPVIITVNVNLEVLKNKISNKME